MSKATRNRRRTEWRQVSGKWTRSLGERGLRVRLFQKRKGGMFYRAVWLRRQGWDVASLGTSERDEAERLGRAFHTEVLRRTHANGERMQFPGPVRLGELWRRYSTECPGYLDNKPQTRKDYAGRAVTLLAFFGERCDARSLSARDQAAYVARRKAGGIVLPNGKVRRPVRTRSADLDVAVLHVVLNWAVTVRLPDGSRLLDSNPLAGVRREHEKNPRQPVASWDRFCSTRAAMQMLASEAKTDAEATLWTKMELALVLAEATGRRLGSIRQLCWEDVDFDRRTIRWRPEFDKKGREWVVPMHASLVDELRHFRTRLGAIGGWIFVAEHNAAQPMDRTLFDKWLRFAEGRAKLPKLDGGLWHPYRRKWATERKHHSLKDVAAAGGWKTTAALLASYQQPDPETILQVMSEPRRLRDLPAVRS